MRSRSSSNNTTSLRRAQCPPLFPPGTLVPTERPDFLLGDGQQAIGIEVTELCRAEPHAIDARLTVVIEDAKARYGMSGGAAVDMSAAFHRQLRRSACR